MQLHIASKNWFRNLMCSHLAYENTQFWISTNYFMSNQMKLILAFDFFRAHEVQCYLVLHIGMVQELPTIDTGGEISSPNVPSGTGGTKSK